MLNKFPVFDIREQRLICTIISGKWEQHIGNNMSDMTIDGLSVVVNDSPMHTDKAKIDKRMKCVPVISAKTATRIQEKPSVIFLINCMLVTGVSKGIQRTAVLSKNNLQLEFLTEFTLSSSSK